MVKSGRVSTFLLTLKISSTKKNQKTNKTWMLNVKISWMNKTSDGLKQTIFERPK